jgi:hypothetical protein
MLKETVICVCDRVSRIDNCVAVSRYRNKWDLRTHEDRFYCRSCVPGKAEAMAWLRENNDPEDFNKD